MITQEQNDRLTLVGPGTPMGNLLRRYWHPVGTRVELDQEPVQPVRLLGENLTLFRSERGEIGLIGERCAHRAISLAYGIPQVNGLRCCYHGWTYDIFRSGAYKRRLLEGAPQDSDDWTTGHPMIFPNMVVVPAGLTPGYQIRVPVDDTTTIHLIYNGRPRAPEEPTDLPLRVERPTLDHDERGLVVPKNAIEQDEMAWTGQGPISNRPGEHLATSDAGVLPYRKLLPD